MWCLHFKKWKLVPKYHLHLLCLFVNWLFMQLTGEKKWFALHKVKDTWTCIMKLDSLKTNRLRDFSISFRFSQLTKNENRLRPFMWIYFLVRTLVKLFISNTVPYSMVVFWSRSNGGLIRCHHLLMSWCHSHLRCVNTSMTITQWQKSQFSEYIYLLFRDAWLYVEYVRFCAT